MKKFLLSLFASAMTLGMSAQNNLLENAGFEEWNGDVPAYWKSASTASNATLSKSTDAHSGNFSVCVGHNASSNKRLAYKELCLKAGTYTFSFYAKGADADGSCNLRPGYVPLNEEGAVGSYVYGEYVDKIANNWTEVNYEFTLESESTVCLVVMNSKSGQSDALIDDASLTTADGGVSEGGAGGGDVVTPPTGDFTIAQALAAAVGTNVSIVGTVSAACKNGAVIGDATGYMFYYNTSNDLVVGDVVKMEGAVSAYGGFNQLTGAAQVTKLESGAKVTYPNAQVLDGAGLDAWFAAPQIAYVQVTGELVVSGNYYNLTVDGATMAIGSLISPRADVLGDVTSGSRVTVTGFAMYTSGGKYVNIVATELMVGEKAETTDITNTLETAYTVSQCIAIIDAGKGLDNKVYVKGTICAPYRDVFIDLNYGNATFFISEDGSTDGQQFEIFRGYDFGGLKFTEEKFKLGDEVVFYGTLTKYKDTYETNQGAELVLLNGVGASAISGIEAEGKDAAIYDLSGRRVQRAEKGLFIVNGKKMMR